MNTELQRYADVRSCPRCFADQGVTCRTPVCPQLKTVPESAAKACVTQLVLDLSDRGGLGNTWDEIDEVTQDQIREAWAKIILTHIQMV